MYSEYKILSPLEILEVNSSKEHLNVKLSDWEELHT